MVPSGWSRRKITEILERVAKPVSPQENTKYREIGIRSHGKGIFHKDPITSLDLGNKRVFEVIPNSFVVNIVFAWEQAVAKTTKNEIGFIASHRFPQFQPKNNSCNIDYLLYLFKTPKGKYLLGLASPGGAGRNKTLGQKEFEKLELLLPNVHEQQKIAQILNTWDKAISTTESLIANSQQQKKSLMQQFLTGKKRFIGFKAEWKLKGFTELYKVANNKRTQIKSSDYLSSGTAPIVDQGKSLIAGYTNNSSLYKDLPVIIFGDHTRIIKWVDFVFAQGADGTQVLKVSDKLDAKFGYYLLDFIDIPNLGYSRHMRELKEKDFKYPIDKTEQQKIASVLTSADQEIETLQQKLIYLKQEKKALMQQLLTGKRRVKVDNETEAV